jgi:hypothetical protein
MCLGWVKQRLMLGYGPAVYSLDVAGPALPTARMTHPTPSWAWTAFTDSPTGILGAGYAGQNSGCSASSSPPSPTPRSSGPGWRC